MTRARDRSVLSSSTISRVSLCLNSSWAYLSANSLSAASRSWAIDLSLWSSAAISTLSSWGKFSIDAAAGFVVAVSSSDKMSPFDEAAVAGESMAEDNSEESDRVKDDLGPAFRSFVLESERKDSGRVWVGVATEIT